MWAVPEFSQDLAEFLKFSSIKGLRVLQNPIVIGWQIDRDMVTKYCPTIDKNTWK